MEFTQCYRCMGPAERYPCPHCGYDPSRAVPQPHALKAGTILNGKYVVGTILGQGGFGITYVGWDLALESKVAIKEYFPSGQVVRSPENSVTLQWYTTPQAEAARNAGREMFLKEARKMSRVSSIPQVVRVRNLFQQNDTAYIVMDFVEGQTLKESLRKTGPITWDQAKEIFLPAIRAMEQVHREGLIHRDLSPDNLMLQPDGTVRILDLGAAKDLNVNSGASSMQVAKGGFSPLEQYTQRGGSGTWSDVYAMAATMYYSLTGVLPPASVDRVETDGIRWDLPGLTVLPQPVLRALQGALAVFVKDRTQTMGEFLAQLEKSQAKAAPKSGPTQKREKKKFPLPILAAVLAVVLIAGWVLRPGDAQEPRLESQTQTEAVPEPETTVPAEPQSLFPLSMQQKTICCGAHHTVAMKANGTVVATGSNEYSQCDVSTWTDIVYVTAGEIHTVGLKADGTVLAAGSNDNGQCNVSTWTDIVDVTAGDNHTVGLKTDDTVVATGNNDYGQCDVSGWTDIVAIDAEGHHTVGLRADGTVVATGWNEYAQCDVSGWTDVVAIGVGAHYTVGLRADGTVVATGWNEYGQCDVSGWTDVVAVGVGGRYTVGLRADGTVVATGENAYAVSQWTDIRIPGTNP